MVNLRTSMDSSFYDLNVATPQTLHGSARSIPGEFPPLDGAYASKLLRMQQLSLLGLGFPLGWLGLVGQIRPMKLLSSIKAEAFRADSSAPRFKRLVKKFFDKSFYSVGLSSNLDLSESTSVMLNVEKDGQSENRRTKAILLHKLPDHDITLEAAWPELFVDRNGKYWDMPESISLDCLSLISDSGLRYRFGLHKNGGSPKAVDSVDSRIPASLTPGINAKAAFSYEKSKDLWRKPETKEDLGLVQSKRGEYLNAAYDLCMKEPHAAISGIFGGMSEDWFGGKENTNGKSCSLGADLFGSICIAIQHGKFRKPYGDLTRFDARLDVSSVSTLANLKSSSSVSPQLNIILQISSSL